MSHERMSLKFWGTQPRTSDTLSPTTTLSLIGVWSDCLLVGGHTVSRGVTHSSLYPQKRLSLRDVCTILTRAEKVDTLVLRDLEFDPDPALPGEQFSFDVESLSLEDLFSSISNDPEEIEITRCAIDSLTSLPNSYVLLLNDIVASENIWRPLAAWAGQILIIESYPSFDDHLLGRMASGGTTGDEFMCPQLAELKILRCPNFSVTALKHLVQNRREMAARTNPWNYDADIDTMDFDIASPLTALRVFGGPPLSAEDKEWFQRNLLSFRWWKEARQETS
ncbi:hypothetical protein BV22DRAFT_1174057 [Leucogyrophana mollusca]|uniref:Uncharacterized protein n=1 Tax=Leucogyrophana mollusca TaxID=85980 RepID=A0ACB8BAU0_9AGAM|nr:hypothetical protein BV22DRAFT_1174057 [Leucogyrophana mollusca]